MRRGVTVWALIATPLAVAAVIATPSCSSNSTSPVGLASGCSINTDCQAPLVCVFGLCHEACAETRDCPAGEHCVSSGANKVCELPAEGTCTSPSSSCPTGLVCGQGQCRNSCNSVGDCVSGQSCEGGACYDPGELDASSDVNISDGASSDTSTSSDSPGDGPAVDAGPLGYVGSNLGSINVADGGLPEGGEGVGAGGAIDFTNAPVVTVSANCTNACLPPPIVITQSDGSQADLYVLKSLTVESSTTLAPADTRPVIFVVQGAVDVQGTITVAANVYIGGPGATSWGGPTGPQGPGGGGNGYTANYPASAGGGGSMCGVGGKGGAPSGTQAPGGSVYGNATITPLVAGSAGGYSNGYQWGAGGGAIQISSGASILVRTVGIINAGGGGGTYAGGGSGGAILLEAPTITIQGNVVANGGAGGSYSINGSQVGPNAQASGLPAIGAKSSAGAKLGGDGAAAAIVNGGDGSAGDASIDVGGGGGGEGYIRLNSTSGKATITGTVSPDLTTTCASQGTLH